MDNGSSGELGPGPAWTAGQVARHLGIAVSTLRTWHHRYGLGPGNAEPGRYRRYAAADVARLERMRDLVRTGVLPSEAARAVSQLDGRPLGSDLVDVLAAARDLDSHRCLAVLEQALSRRGVLEVWERVCRPALAAVDGDQRDDPDCIDSEHALSWAITAALHRVRRPPATERDPLVLACTDAEQHCLPLEALAAALAERRVPVRMLGAATPTSTLLHAVSAVRPAAVVLWSLQRATARPEAARAVAARGLRTITVGPGWPARRPAGVEYANRLADAVELLTRVC